MATFKKLKKVRSILNELPGVATYTEFDILIEIGYYQEHGSPLTLKQLLLLGISSQATVRRHLGRLVKDGIVIKTESINDHRSVILTLSGNTIQTLTALLTEIITHLAHHVPPHQECPSCDSPENAAAIKL